MKGIRKFSKALAIAVGLAAGPVIGAPVQAETLTIGAAYSLKAAFQEVVPMFESEFGASVKVVYGSSQTLRREVEAGSPVDVLLSAVDDLEKLHKKGLTLNGGPEVYAQTSLVFVMSAASQAMPISFHEMSSERRTRVAIGAYENSAAGPITARALRAVDPSYKDRFRLISATHHDEVINMIRKGEAEVGLVYRVDAINNSGQVRIIDETPGGTYTPVRFGQAVVWTCRDEARAAAEQFSDFFKSARIQKLLLKYGFEPATAFEGAVAGRRTGP
ncbi:MAG: Molybdenum ABC transporter, periplasmic molybdenum-binding protein ModA [Nitrospira sp.]|nr:molybdate ABC transporter substrate-binding protein [Nitrospira sp.]ULA60255.1 MAG: Molybdenum ABC transporter, periplasmic molybdenum-binding protein ModA [Nitrospira sp.]